MYLPRVPLLGVARRLLDPSARVLVILLELLGHVWGDGGRRSGGRGRRYPAG